MSTSAWAIIFLAAFILPWLFVRALGNPKRPPDEHQPPYTSESNWLDDEPEWMRAFGGFRKLSNQELRHARMQENGGYHTRAEWFALCEYYGGRCLRCKRKRRLTKDHVVPVLLGGSDDIDNIQPLCQSCNSSKGATIADYRRPRKGLTRPSADPR